MYNLEKDELFHITMFLDLHDLLQLCSSSKKLNNLICLNDNIWWYKLAKDYPEYKEFSFDITNPREIYKLLYRIDAVKHFFEMENWSLLELYSSKELYVFTEHTEIPSDISVLTNLEHLEITENGIETIPESISNLTKLKSLNLYGNTIESVPESLSNLTNLTDLDLSHNRIESVPKSLSNLTNLTNLDLSFNEIKSVTKSLSNLTNLTNLDLSNNYYLNNIPEVLFEINININISNTAYEDHVTSDNDRIVNDIYD